LELDLGVGFDGGMTTLPAKEILPSGSLSKTGTIVRALHLANCTLAGRLILGPAIAVAKFWSSEARMVRSGDRRRILIWSHHVVTVAMVLSGKSSLGVDFPQ